MFHSKIGNFLLMSKIFMGYVEWTFKHQHVKYLSDLILLKFSHKCKINYQIYFNITHLSGLQ